MPYNPKVYKLRVHPRSDGKIRWYRTYSGKRFYLATGRKSDQSVLREAIGKVKAIDKLIASGVPVFKAVEQVLSASEEVTTTPPPASDAAPATKAAPTTGSIRLAADEFLKAKSATGSVKKTRIYILSKDLAKFVDDFPYQKVSRLSGRRGLETLVQKFKPIVKARVDAGEMKATSAQQYFQSVKQFIGWLIWRGYIEEPPQYNHPEYGLSIKVPAAIRNKQVVRNVDTFSEYSLCKLIDNCSPEMCSDTGGFKGGLRRMSQEEHAQTYAVLKACILLAVNCGFGQSDCADLRISDISARTKTKRINRVRTKTGIARSFLMWDETYEVLKPFMKGKSENDIVLLQPNGKPLIHGADEGKSTDVIGSRFKRYLARFDMKKGETDPRSFRAIRKSVATYWMRVGGLEARSFILQHKDGLIGRFYSANDSNLKRMDEISMQHYNHIVQHRKKLKKASPRRRKVKS